MSGCAGYAARPLVTDEDISNIYYSSTAGRSRVSSLQRDPPDQTVGRRPPQCTHPAARQSTARRAELIVTDGYRGETPARELSFLNHVQCHARHYSAISVSFWPISPKKTYCLTRGRERWS